MEIGYFLFNKFQILFAHFVGHFFEFPEKWMQKQNLHRWWATPTPL